MASLPTPTSALVTGDECNRASEQQHSKFPFRSGTVCLKDGFDDNCRKILIFANLVHKRLQRAPVAKER